MTVWGRWRRSPSTTAVVAWLAVVGTAWATGSRFSTATLATDWQVLPLDALRTDPFGSVWHLHTQPPLWNLIVGVAARWSPLGTSGTLWAAALAAGAALVWVLCELALLAGLGRRAAPALAVAAALQPAVLTNLFAARYEMLTALLVSLAVLAVATRRTGWCIGATTALVMLRSLYHPALLVALLALWWWAHRPSVSWRNVLRLAVVPVLLVGGWMAKNAVQTGTPTMSSWGGMNALRSVQGAVDPADLADLAARGTISGVGATPTFSPYADYAEVVSPCSGSSDVPVLSEATKGTMVSPFTGAVVDVPNFNHECFEAVYAAAARDFRALLRHRPGDWLEARLWALDNWPGVADVSPVDGPVPRALTEVGRIGLLAVPHPPAPPSWEGHEVWVHQYPVSITLIVCTLAVFAAAAQALRRRTRTPSSLAVIATALLVAWTLVVGVVAELGEQDRFRSVLDPLVVVVGGTVAARWVARHTRRRIRSPRPPTSTALAAVVVVLGVAVVALRDGGPTVLTERPEATTATTSATPSTQPGATTTAAPTTTVAPRPSCRHVVHLGDSNLGLAVGRFSVAYDSLGVEATIDHANGRGAATARDGGTTAIEAIRTYTDLVPASGRCWIIALSDADAATAWRDGLDPADSIEPIVAELGDDPVLWVTPVLVSTVSEWNLEASTSYNLALTEIVGRHANIDVLDWQDIALDHLDQFNPDGIHYTDALYGLLVDTVVAEIERVWDLAP